MLRPRNNPLPQKKMLSVGAPPSTAALPHLIRRHRPLPCLLLLFGSRVAAAVSIPRPGRHRFIPLLALRRGQRGRKLGEADEDAGWSRVSDEDDENEDVDESMLPFQEMREWLRSKPAGFGEGKNYDTRLEDELWEEIERSRKAQIENLNKLKNKPKMSDDRSKTKEKAPHKGEFPICSLISIKPACFTQFMGFNETTIIIHESQLFERIIGV